MPYLVTACSDAALGSEQDEKSKLAVCKKHNDGADYALNTRPRHTVLFFDQSSSVQGSEENEYVSKIKDRIRDDLPVHGSVVELYLVHSRTTGGAGALRFVQDLPLPRKRPFIDETKNECNQYAIHIQGLQRQAWGLLQDRLATPYVNKANRQATDLWGVLEVASTALSVGPPDAERAVYVFSDMMECMGGAGRRCFERTPPASRKQAESWAETDARTLQVIQAVDVSLLQQAS